MSTTVDPEPRAPSEAERVEDWREHELLRAGFPADDAITLSRDPAVDLHAACALLAAGCDPLVALRILT